MTSLAPVGSTRPRRGLARCGTVALLASLLSVASGSVLLAQDAITVDASGNVGIGTSAPQHPFHVVVDGGEPAGILLGNPGGKFFMKITSDGDGQLFVRDRASANRIFLNSTSNSFFTGGNVGIGTQSPVTLLEIEKTSTSGPVLTIENSLGTCDFTPKASGEPTMMCDSDLRLKRNPRLADTASVLRDLARIQLYEYESIANGETLLGPVAQDLLLTHPERVRAAEDGILMAELPGRAELLAAVQELIQENRELRGRVEALEEGSDRSEHRP